MSTPRNSPYTDSLRDFQDSTRLWVVACFGRHIADDIRERNHRFLEEALELVQSKGCSQADAHTLVDYVYGRPIGAPPQEVGGVMVTLAALCSSADIDLEDAAWQELVRAWQKIDAIRAKQAAKPVIGGPLP